MIIEKTMKKREKENYEKNYKKAEQEAKKIMLSATDSEIDGLRTSLTVAPKPEPKEKEQEKEQEQHGFLGSFNQKLTHLKKTIGRRIES